MLKFNFSAFFRLIITLILLLPVVFNEYRNHNYQILYAGYFDGILYLILLFIFAVIVVIDIVSLVKTKNASVILPSVIGMTLIATSVFIHFYHENRLYESTLYIATSKEFIKNDIGVKYRIEFKESGNYVLFEVIDQGISTKYYYGNYTQKDSLMLLDRKIENLNFSNRFLIVKADSIKKDKLQLVQIDNSGNKFNNRITFRFE